MGTTLMHAVASLDGYIADEHDDVGPLHDWYFRIERDFDPEAVRRMKARAGRDISVGGPDLAAQAINAGLVDEVQLFLTPIMVGGGIPSFPPCARLNLELLDELCFGSGVVYLHYRITT